MKGSDTVPDVKYDWHIHLRFTLDHGWEVNGPGCWGNGFLTPWGAYLWAWRIRRG